MAASLEKFLMLLLVTAIVTPWASAQANLPRVPALFILGDGTVDAGTNTYVNSTSQASTSPYGETYFGHAAGRLTNGRTIVDFLAQSLGLPLVPPFVQPLGDHRYGANFASAGSGLLDSTGASKGVVTFSRQLSQLRAFMAIFKWRGKSEAETTLGESVFVISTGAEDIASYAEHSASGTEEEFVQSLIDTSFLSRQELYDGGARKIAVVELGPVGCYPRSRLVAPPTDRMFQRSTCFDLANILAREVNAGLDDLAKTLPSQLTGIQLVVLKPYQLLMNAIRSPLTFGFFNSVDACCGAGRFHAEESCADSYTQTTSEFQPFLCVNPGTFMFFDGAHLSEAAYLTMFKFFWHGDEKFASPFNLKDLFAGNTVPFPPLAPRFKGFN